MQDVTCTALHEMSACAVSMLMAQNESRFAHQEIRQSRRATYLFQTFHPKRLQSGVAFSGAMLTVLNGIVAYC